MGAPVQPSAPLARLHRTSVIAAGILSLADGQRSIRDIARVLAASSQTDARALEPELRAFCTMADTE
ncbi:MAG TPA: hypothetical protein VG937_16080 [Polyangiaceae bacterium]|jgi:hypothetical protein|nr:hypothetical protein [Polyangiaceae bacterium]